MEQEKVQIENKKKWLIVAAIVAVTVAIIAGAGIWAYLTDHEEVSNIFTVGKVDITLTEPNWDADNAKNITAKMKIAKDPTVKNVGANDAYVYLKVRIPKVKLKDTDTTKTPLFTYQVNAGWSELTGKTVEEDSYIEKVYYYNQDEGVLAVNSETPALFNEVQVANITSDTTYTTETGETKRLAEATNYKLEQVIKINAYAIQINNLPDGRNTVQTAYDVVQGNEEPDRSLVAQGIKVGDYVNYDATSGNGAGKAYTVNTSESGSEGTAETFNSGDVTKWRVFSIKNGQIELIPEQPISQKLTLNGANGYINAEAILNGIGSIYGYGNGAVAGRSINIDDIDQYFQFDKTTYEYPQTGFKYGDTNEYASGRFIINDEIVQGPKEMTQTYYEYAFSDCKYEEAVNPAANKVYKMLCEDMNTYATGGTPFFLASRCVNLYPSDCFFIVRCISDQGTNYSNMFSANGYTDAFNLHVLPVVTLESGIEGTKGQNGVWNLNV